MTLTNRRKAVALLAVLAAAPARAQTDAIFDPTPPRIGQPTSPLIGTALEPAVRLGQDLYAAGILPRLRYVQSFAANPVGGLSQGTDTSGVVIFGTDLDLQKLVGIQGARVHVSFAQFYGHELSTDHIGARTKVQSFYYPKKQFELSELTWEQRLWDNRVTVVVGRANATGEFARSTYGCRFQGVADCPFELTQAVGGFPGFPYVNWGGHVRLNPTPETYVKAGAFETNSTRNLNTGFDWGLNHSTGYVLPVEIGYGTEYATDPYSRHFKLGGWYNTAPYNDPFLNTAGRSRGTFGGKPMPRGGGRAGAYALADQVVWKPEQAGTRGVAVFATAGLPFDGRELFAFQGVAGGIWTGPLAGRPADQMGIQGSYLRVSNRENGYLNDLLRKARSTTFESRNEFIFEVNYNARLIDGVFLAASLQYLVNPDTISRTVATFASKDALVVGLKLSVGVNDLLGLPSALPR